MLKLPSDVLDPFSRQNKEETESKDNLNPPKIEARTSPEHGGSVDLGTAVATVLAVRWCVVERPNVATVNCLGASVTEPHREEEVEEGRGSRDGDPSTGRGWLGGGPRVTLLETVAADPRVILLERVAADPRVRRWPARLDLGGEEWRQRHPGGDGAGGAPGQLAALAVGAGLDPTAG